MNNHYSDYVSKNVQASEVTFEKVQDSDKEIVKGIHNKHIRSNVGLLIALFIGLAACATLFFGTLFQRSNSIIVDIICLGALLALMIFLGKNIYDVLGPVTDIRKGVILASQRMQEKKDNRNATYQYVFDIFMEETDQTLMSFQVRKEVFEDIAPGDGVILFKRGKKIRVLADPSRKGVMNVSNIRSGI